MTKINKEFKASVIEKDGFYYVVQSGTISPPLTSRHVAAKYIHAHFEQAKELFGETLKLDLKYYD